MNQATLSPPESRWWPSELPRWCSLGTWPGPASKCAGWSGEETPHMCLVFKELTRNRCGFIFLPLVLIDHCFPSGRLQSTYRSRAWVGQSVWFRGVVLYPAFSNNYQLYCNKGDVSLSIFQTLGLPQLHTKLIRKQGCQLLGSPKVLTFQRRKEWRKGEGEREALFFQENCNMSYYSLAYYV